MTDDATSRPFFAHLAWGSPGASEGRPSIPDLELVERIARTNLNEVWKAKRLSDGKPVAVKLATTAMGPEMLRQEAQMVQALLARSVTGVVAAEFRNEPIAHAILPWKGGRTLRDVVDAIRTAEDRSRAMAVFLQVVQTVAAAHREGFLHGDLKPENILLDEDGRPWLADFGMARAIRTARLESHISLSMSESETGWGGTIHYLPPEGLHGDAPTASWDVYALGVMMQEILLGRRPDRAATPENLKSILPGETVDVLLASLAYSPNDRLTSAGALLIRLRRIGDELTAMGFRRAFFRLRRGMIVGLAAFFVALRYGSVFALVALYAANLVASWFQPAFLFAYLPFILLHIVIRWEGPETPEEAQHRRRGTLYARR